MREVFLHCNHADVVLREDPLAVFHHGGRLTSKHQGVKVFDFGSQHIARHLIVANMTAQHEEAFGAVLQSIHERQSLYLKLVLLACIRAETVQDNLTETEMVGIPLTERL